MAIGDDATAAGYPLVPNTGSGGEVKFGAREINRTRDFIAQVKALISTRTITNSTIAPVNTDGADGDIHYQTLP